MSDLEQFRVDGKVALVTGAARGQGEAEARLLARAGARVVVTDVLDEQGRRWRRTSATRRASCTTTSATKRAGPTAVDVATSEFGRLDVLVNNAGILKTAALEEQTLEGFEAIVRVNLYGVFNGIRAVIAPMRASGGGSIINTSSEAGLVGLPRYTAYGATKWAVRGLTKTAALELGRDGIRVNSVHPGIVDTPMLVEEGLRLEENMVPMVRLGRYGLPSDIADLVLFLASDASSYITGAELHINGGGLDPGR